VTTLSQTTGKFSIQWFLLGLWHDVHVSSVI